jgi:serine/threonine-protein kinase
VETAVHRCLEKTPDARVQNGKDLIQLLRHANGGTRPPTPRTRAAAAQPTPTRRTQTPPRRRGAGWTAAIIVTILLALGSLGWYASRVFMKPPAIPVPALAGLTQADAEARLRQQKLSVAAVEKRWGTPQEHDLVIEQRPPTGTQVAPGTRVVLVIGIGKTAVPDLVGLPLEEAIASLRTSALAVGETTRVAGGADQKDRVVLMFPQPGTEVGKEAKVNLSIGE